MVILLVCVLRHFSRPEKGRVVGLRVLVVRDKALAEGKKFWLGLDSCCSPCWTASWWLDIRDIRILVNSPIKGTDLTGARDSHHAPDDTADLRCIAMTPITIIINTAPRGMHITFALSVHVNHVVQHHARAEHILNLCGIGEFEWQFENTKAPLEHPKSALYILPN
jgi:hypothetical protein